MAELKRTLGFWMTSSFVFLNLVNTGIFFGVQIGATVGGIDSLIAWIILACMSVYTAMCFSELATMFPKAGGVYEFAKQAYGRFVSFEVGWVIWLINNIATALLVIAAMEYMIPLETIMIAGVVFSGSVVKLALAIAIILLMNYIAYRGADESARLMMILAIVTLIVGILVIVPGLMSVQMSEFVGFAFNWPLILLAAFLLSETFFGWESVTFMAEEIKKPEVTIPRALNYTAIFVAITSVVVAIVTFGVLGVEQLSNGTVTKPIIVVLEQLGLSEWLVLFANVGIVATFLGNAAGGIIGNPRLLMALSRDKQFIEQFDEIHPKYQTPYRGIILQSIAAIVIIIFAAGAFQRLLELLVAPSMMLYASMLFLVPYFRWNRPKEKRPYRAPFGAFLPLLLVLIYVLLFAIWIFYDPAAMAQLRLLGSFLVFSIPIYLLLTYFYNPDALIKTMNRFATLNLIFENFLLPKRVRRQVLEFIPDAKNKHLLELGSGVGSLTLHLAEHIGPGGKLYAVDLSEHNTHILRKRVNKKGHKHVHIIHDPHLVNRVHPSVESVDVVVSVGNLSYIQNLQKVLKEIFNILPHHGQICFVEYTDFFWFLPNNPKWLSNTDEVRKIFSEAGFSVNVEVKHGLFWNYLYIHGLKEKSGVPFI